MYNYWTFDRLKPKDWKGKGQPLWAHAKLDGWRATLFKDDGLVYIFGRETWSDLEMINKYPRLKEDPLVQAFTRHAPRWSAVDCEITTDGPASDVPTALRGERNILKMTPFAVPVWNNIWRASAPLNEIEEGLNAHLGATMADFWCIDGDVDEKELLRVAKSRGWEGFVLKEANYKGWWKLKEKRSVDCVVIAIQPGKGKYIGQVGSLVVAAWVRGELREIANVSGMTDAERSNMGVGDIGRVVEVEYQYVGNGSRLRHPRFVRFRDDKPEKECILC